MMFRNRRMKTTMILFCGTLCSICCCAAGEKNLSQPERFNAGYVAEGKDALQLADGILHNGVKPVIMNLDFPLEENSRVSIPVRFGKSGMLKFETGRGRESFQVYGEVQGEQVLRWDYADVKGISHCGTFYGNRFGADTKFYIAGRATPNFSWTDNVLNWTDYYRSTLSKPLQERWIGISLEIRDGRCRFSIDGVFLHEWEVSTDIYGKKLRISVPPETALKTAEIRRLGPENPLYLPLDISVRLNANLICREKLDGSSMPIRGNEFDCAGIPFILPELSGDNDHVDLGVSWFRECALPGYEEPHSGSFGGRWGGVFKFNPARVQFRVPQRQYNAIYLLAASEEKANSIPRLSAQFFRLGAGFPKNFVSPQVPLFTAKAERVTSFPIKTVSGKPLNLWLVKIGVEPGQLQEFGDLDALELELTKDVHTYRMYPDPAYYSAHGGGLPSSVKVFAVTMGISPVNIAFEPEELGNVWAEPAKPSYSVKAKNNDMKTRKIRLELCTVSYDRDEKSNSISELLLRPGEEKNTRFDLSLRKYGHHQVTLLVNYDDISERYERTLSMLRRREIKARSFDAKGFMFGYWNWSGLHLTPGAEEEAKLMGMLGMESTSCNLPPTEAAKKYGIKNYWAGPDCTPKNFTKDPEKALAELAERWEKHRKKPVSEIDEPVYVNVFAEPGGLGTHGVLSEFYGEKEQTMSESELASFKYFSAAALAGAKMAKRFNPNAKILFPWGDPVFAVPFLKAKDELTDMIDGIGFDTGFFDRMPEQQMHQCSIHRMYQFKYYWDKIKEKPPVMPSVEGPCLAPVTAGALTEEQYAAHMMRCALLLAAYGVNRQFSLAGSADCADYWGEQHYGSGLMGRINSLNPHVAYSSAGTLVRHLRTMEFVKWIPTGSLSTYCLEFKDAESQKKMHVLWTVRGKRDAEIPMKAGKVEIFDAMDNLLQVAPEKGLVKFSISQFPVFVYGLGDSPVLSLGVPEHSDLKIGAHVRLLGNAVAILTRQSQDSDPEYLDVFPEAIRRFPAKMNMKTVEASREFGGKALSIELPLQEKDRGVMPFYTTFSPEKPIVIPGKAQYISVWVKASSDWGRIVYVLRDAKGEKWTSVGSKGEWNCDDTPNASFFNFDGWRLVRFELPSNAPYDRYREMGSTWWGSSGGDGIVDLPVALEKVFIERRPKVMYVNSLEPANPASVELGDMLVEYASAGDMTDNAVVLDRLTMPSPPAPNAGYSNPIAELAAKGTLPETNIIAVEQPEHYYDGTRGIFKFKEVADSDYYDIWISLNPDGRGALKLGNRIKSSGALVNNFRADTDFYAFIVYRDKKGGFSKPSDPFLFRMKNMFGMK